MEEIKYEIDDTYVHYVKFGSGPKKLVIIAGVSLLGFEGLGGSMQHKYSIFSEDYTCYVFDRRKKIEKPVTIKDFSNDIYSILFNIGVNKADFLGFSQGGIIAMDMAIRYPSLVNKLVVSGSIVKASEISLNCSRTWLEYLAKDDVYGFHMDFFKRIYSDEFYQKHYEPIERLAHMGSVEDIRRFERIIHATDGFDMTKDIAAIKCPALVIGGGKDNTLGVEASRVIARSMNCKYIEFENCSHSIYEEEPSCKEKIKEFLLANE